MKKIISKLKGKKVLSFVLAAIMLATTFNIALPMLKLDASAAIQYDSNGNIIIDGVTQTAVVGDRTTYNTYASNYLGGASYSTGIVIPGLDPAQDYVIQGMTYYPKRDWMLVTAYHNVADGETTQSSKVFALDAATGKFVAMFSFLNLDGSVNTDHGGGIAVSENNIYYSCGDKDRKIAYAPLSALENAPLNAHTQIQLVAEKDFVEIGSISSSSKTAYSAYVCYDDGILWMGNFYDQGADLIGITIAAADYNAPSNNTYNSMVFGYKLSGSTSAEEWANLTGAGAKSTDCQGNPSYAIGLSNNLKDVQYAVVDNGKLYLSRSYGSGAGNSINFGFGESSFLTIADIDLSQPGTVPVKISTTSTGSLDKTVNAYDISDYKDYAMMPMSEGLCVINNEIFITFEGASNKYLNESSGLTSIGNCEMPVDVIWQLDPYDLLDVEVAEAEKSTHYKKINSLAEIEDGKEYIIAYESPEKDPVTQKNILYAFDAFGNFKDYKLSKSNASAVKGYNGMIGHAIKDYALTEDGTLYLNQPEIDDVENIRWTLNKNGEDGNYRITNTSTYFANCNCFYFDEDQITMAPSNADYLNNIRITQLNSDNGKFYFNNEGYRLWCNDGVKADYNNKINTYYANKGGFYSGLTEQAGTFHCDALNTTGSNVIGAPIPKDNGDYNEGAFYIFERVVDESSSTYESRVYTGLDSKLQADGTYTVTFETYAISPNHYLYRGEKPTDYIIVADTSNTMNNVDGTGIVPFYNSNLTVNSMSIEDNTKDDNGKNNSAGSTNVVVGYGFTDEEIYYKHSADGKYYPLYMGIRNEFSISKYLKIWSLELQYYYLYYIADDGYYYCFTNQQSTPTLKYTEADFKAWVQGNSDKLQTASSSKSNNSDRVKEVLFTGEHYRFDNVNHHPKNQEISRISSLKETTKDLIGDIAAENPQNRIALITYGSGSSYLGKSGWASSGFTDAFWEANSNNVDTLKTGIENASVSTQTRNDGIEFDNVNEIIANSRANYKGADSDRNVAIILLTDGVAGADGGSDPTAAANQVIAKALTAKQNGAFIYTAIIGADGTSFDRNTYLEAVSSKYAEAESMATLGGQSVDGINYNLSIATASIDNFVNFGAFALKETSMNNGVGLENLDVNSYLRGELTNVFMSFNEDNIKVELVPGTFDKIGRFTFDEAKATTNHEVKHNVDVANRTITVTNYDYADQYIAKNRKTPGNKLKITISDLLLDPEADLTNRTVTNTDTTGIYKDSVEFKGVPTENVNVNDYTYVLDYGLQMLDTDINGTVKSVSAGLTAQVDADGNLAYKDVSENGLLAIQEGNQNLLYHTTPTNMSDSGYVLKYVEETGKYEWFEIKVVPASNVYFEETEFDTTSGTGTVAWSTTTGGTSADYRDLPKEFDVDGYDEAYNNTNTYSNGKTLSAAVDASNKRSKTATVNFAGDGIDIISACGPTTGLQIINIKDKDGKSVKAGIVDTYYSGGNFTQVPVFSWRGTHGTYTVESTAVYLSTAGALNATSTTNSTTKGIKNNLFDTAIEMNTSTSFNEKVLQAMLDEAGIEDIDAKDVELIWHDDNSILNGGTGVAPVKKSTRGAKATATDITLYNYLDGFRIYNPLGADSDSYTESEKNASYVNVIKNLAPVGDGKDNLDGIGFVTGTLGEGQTNLNFSNYESVGPKDEFYLLSNQTVTFNTKINVGEKVMLGLRAVNGPVTVKITSDKTDKNVEITVKSATEMFYDISNCIGDITADNTTVQVIVQNTEGNMLAVNQVKFSGGTKINTGNTPEGRSLARSVNAVAPVVEDVFLPLTPEALTEVEISITEKETVQGEVKNGVIVPVEEEIPEDNTNDKTDTEDSKEEFSIFSIVEMIIGFIEKILSSLFGLGSIA